MPRCPLHQSEELEPKRKGWFCEECGAIVFGYESVAAPAGSEFAQPKEPVRTGSPQPRASHSLPSPAMADTSPLPLSKHLPVLVQGDELTRWGLVSAAAQFTEQALASLGGVPAVLHAPRVGVDEVLSLCLSRPRRGLLVIGPSGVGKTSLLARIARQALGPSPDETETDDDIRDVVLFLSGRSAYESVAAKTGTERLCETIVRAAGLEVGQFSSLEGFVAHLAKTENLDPKPRRRLWLILDAMDEARSSDELFDALDAFLPILDTYPWIRLVVSMRQSEYDARGARGAEHIHGPCGSFVSERWWTWFWDEATNKEVPYLSLPLLSDEETRSAYELRQKQMGNRSCHGSYDGLSEEVRALLRLPLNLHLFHEAFRGKRGPHGALDELALMDALLDSRVESAPGLDKTLSRLAKTLIRHRRSSLSMDVAEQWKAEWMSKRADRRGVREGLSLHDPIAELGAVTGLMVPEEAGYGDKRTATGWRFIHERLAEQVVLRELLSTILPRMVPTGDEILEWVKLAEGNDKKEPFDTVIGALEALVKRLVARGESAFVAALLRIEDQKARARLLQAALIGIEARWDEEDDAPSARNTLETLMNAGMLRNRAPQLLASAWLPLFDMLRKGSNPVIQALHKALRQVADSHYAGQSGAAGRLAHVTALFALGEIARHHGDLEDARRSFEQVIKLIGDSEERKGAGDAMRSMLAAAHRAVANVLRREGQLRLARRALELALRVASKTDDESQTLPQGQHEQLLLSLLDLGALLHESGSFRESEQVYEEALRAAVAALGESPHRSDLRSHRASALLGLGRIAAATDRSTLALLTLQDAMAVLRKLSRREPQRWDYQLQLAKTAMQCSDLLGTMQKDREACLLHEEAAAVSIALVRAYPQREQWRSDLACSLSNLGLWLRQVGEDEPARACLEDAVTYGKVIRNDVRACRSTVSALMSLVQLDEVEGRRFEARRHVDEALELLERFKDGGEAVERRCFAWMMQVKGRLAAEDEDVAKACAHLEQAMRSLSGLLRELPENMMIRADLGAAINGLRYLGAGGRVRRIPKHRFSVMVTERGGAEIREYFDSEEITVGRAPGNDLMLPNYSVSRHHATIVYHEGVFSVKDLGSKHGTVLRGKKISGTVAFAPGDKLELGDFVLVFNGPVDTDYGARWMTMMAETPTGFPPPVEGNPDSELDSLGLEPITIMDVDLELEE